MDERRFPVKRVRRIALFQLVFYILVILTRIPVAFMNKPSLAISICMGIPPASVGAPSFIFCFLIYAVVSFLYSPLIAFVLDAPKTSLDTVATIHIVYLIVALVVSPPHSLVGLVFIVAFQTAIIAACTALTEFCMIELKMRRGTLSLKILGTAA